MTNVTVLGAGMVGSLIAKDLAGESGFSVTSVDSRPNALRLLRDQDSRVDIREIDLAQPGRIAEAIADADLVCGALSSGVGYRALEEIIRAGKPYCDIAFMPEDAIDLDDLAKEHGVTAIVDCGVAPGMSNLLAGVAAATLDPCDRIEIYVGGLPRERRWPFEYKAGFSPADVIEEYTRPARYVEHGELVVREALSEPELIELPGVDTLEAFNTDGLRSLADTLDVPNMKEKTLRYPGHIEIMRIFRETGFFRQDSIRVGEVDVRPLDVTQALMFPKWTYEEGEEDLTVMRVQAEGQRNGQRIRLIWDLLDFYDADSGETSMARTTAFPCAIMARALASGAISKTGVLPPELLAGDAALVESTLEALQQRGVRYDHTVQVLT